MIVNNYIWYQSVLSLANSDLAQQETFRIPQSPIVYYCFVIWVILHPLHYCWNVYDVLHESYLANDEYYSLKQTKDLWIYYKYTQINST